MCCTSTGCPSTSLEVLDGQQRITSIGRYVTGKFAVEIDGRPHYFTTLDAEDQARILAAELLVYLCEGTETEIKDWFRTVNIAGVPLNPQELLNAVYSGPFVSAAKVVFSNSSNANIAKWSAYVKGVAKRQDFLAVALDWVSEGEVSDYMSKHRNDVNIAEMQNHFDDVIEWASTVFTDTYAEQKGLDWDRLYRELRHQAVQPGQGRRAGRRAARGPVHHGTQGDLGVRPGRLRGRQAAATCGSSTRGPRPRSTRSRPRSRSRRESPTASSA